MKLSNQFSKQLYRHCGLVSVTGISIIAIALMLSLQAALNHQPRSYVQTAFNVDYAEHKLMETNTNCVEFGTSGTNPLALSALGTYAGFPVELPRILAIPSRFRTDSESESDNTNLKYIVISDDCRMFTRTDLTCLASPCRSRARTESYFRPLPALWSYLAHAIDDSGQSASNMFQLCPAASQTETSITSNASEGWRCHVLPR
jgi:hypothetical protein